MNIARVFPRQTTATPDDNLAFVGDPPDNIEKHNIDEVHISVTFSYDMPLIDNLYSKWQNIAPVKIGGPALGDPGGNFTPGMYLKKGYTITSRGCHNKCWFCDVWKREGNLRELPITNGWIIHDSNILACSKQHIASVFQMLKNQEERADFRGLEAKLLTNNTVSMLWNLKPKRMFFAYDTPDDLEPLIEAGKKLRYADFTRSHLACYVLIGYKKDTFEDAEKRLMEAWSAGFLPFAMLYKNKNGDEDPIWRKFQRVWTRPAITKAYVRDQYKKNNIIL